MKGANVEVSFLLESLGEVFSEVLLDERNGVDVDLLEDEPVPEDAGLSLRGEDVQADLGLVDEVVDDCFHPLVHVVLGGVVPETLLEAAENAGKRVLRKVLASDDFADREHQVVVQSSGVEVVVCFLLSNEYHFFDQVHAFDG